MAEQRDLYQVLGISRSADADEIRRAHRQLVRVLHPDRHAQATAAEQHLAERRMREINEAWNTLRDPLKRSSYDATLRSRPTGSASRPGSTNGSSRPAQRSSSTGQSQRPRPGSQASGSRRSTSQPGPGACWSTSSPGRRPTPSHSAGKQDPASGDDSQHISAGAYHLLRRGPVVAVVAALLGLFVATALISGRGTGETTEVELDPMGACISLEDGSDGFIVPCELPNDGEVVAQVEQPLDCPEPTRYAQVGTEFFCIPPAPEG